MAIGKRKLGQTKYEISPIGLGCWQFSAGKGMGGFYWDTLSPEMTDQIVAASIAGGIGWFDSAEIYGGGASEAALARALHAAGKKNGDVLIATKWSPAMRFAGSIKRTIGDRLRYLDGFGIDLHQVHHPLGLSSVAAEMNAMADLVEAGKIGSVGVSNFNARRMRAADAALRARGLHLAANQVHYNLLDRRCEKNGILDAAKELGITIIAYSPLEQGILTGKFHDDPSLIKVRKGPRKLMRAFRSSGLARSLPLIDVLKEIAAAHDVTPAQVALNWLITFHGDTVVAIPGASQPRHVEENVGAMAFELSDSEKARIDTVSRR